MNRRTCCAESQPSKRHECAWSPPGRFRPCTVRPCSGCCRGEPPPGRLRWVSLPTTKNCLGWRRRPVGKRRPLTRPNWRRRALRALPIAASAAAGGQADHRAEQQSHHHRSRNDRAPQQKRWRPSPPARPRVYAAPGRGDGRRKPHGQHGGPKKSTRHRVSRRKPPRRRGGRRKPRGQHGIATAALQPTLPPRRSSAMIPGRRRRHGSRGGPSWLPSSRSCC